MDIFLTFDYSSMQFIGEFSALLTAFLWSGTALAFSAASQRIGPIQLNISRLIIALVFLSITVAVAGISLSMSLYQLECLAISGVVGFIFADTFLFKSFNEIGARRSMLVMSLVPAISAALAYAFLEEGVSGTGVLGIAVTIAGIWLVIGERKERSDTEGNIWLGVGFGLLAALGQSSGLILAKAAFREGAINGFAATFTRIASAVVVFVPLGVAARRFKNPITVYSADKKALLYSVIGSILGPFLGVTFSLIAIANTGVGIASTLMATVPVIMLPLLVFVRKERISWRGYAGAAVAVIGVALLFLK